MATQPHSSIASEVEQGVLALARKPAPVEVALDVIMKRRDLLGAINLMFDVSGLEDKEIYLALDIDAGHFSNIRKGKQGCHFPTNKLNAAMDLCASEIPLIWQAHSRGKGIYRLESEAQRLLRIEREARARAEEKLSYLEGLVTK